MPPDPEKIAAARERERVERIIGLHLLWTPHLAEDTTKGQLLDLCAETAAHIVSGERV